MQVCIEENSISSDKLPVAVDLDGTLFHGDLLLEAILRILFRKPWMMFSLLFAALQGKAFLKARVAELSPCDPTVLPYNERLLHWLRQEQATGRPLILATAADQSEAERVASHLGLFGAVMGSDGRTNLKSHFKAERLRREYPGGFVYAGNARPDLKVWASATNAVIVNADKRLVEQARRSFAVEHIIPRTRSTLRAFIKAARPYQWSKNLLVFLPLLVGQGWAEVTNWMNAAITFTALSFAASSVYIVNDASDIEADRRHHRKRSRPFASGALSPVTGLVGACFLLATGLAFAAIANVLLPVTAYLVCTTLYSFWLKRVVLVDVFLLASLYTLRVIVGGVATGYPASDWLLAFSCFFFLNLALAKRAAEVQSMTTGGELNGRSYFSTDDEVLKMMGIGAGFVSTLVLALYLQNDSIRTHFSEPFLLWGVPAAVVFWVCRLWLMLDRGEMHDDPLVFAFHDKTSLLLGVIAAGAFAGAAVVPSGTLPF